MTVHLWATAVDWGSFACIVFWYVLVGITSASKRAHPKADEGEDTTPPRERAARALGAEMCPFMPVVDVVQYLATTMETGHVHWGNVCGLAWNLFLWLVLRKSFDDDDRWKRRRRRLAALVARRGSRLVAE